MYALLPQAFEQALGILAVDRHLHLLGLIGEFKEMRRMDAAVVAEPFAAGNQRRTGKLHFACQHEQPFADRLPVVALVLLGEESNLVAIHDVLLRTVSARSTTPCQARWPAASH